MGNIDPVNEDQDEDCANIFSKEDVYVKGKIKKKSYEWKTISL